jgi:hypothetical protein
VPIACLEEGWLVLLGTLVERRSEETVMDQVWSDYDLLAQLVLVI